MDLRRWWRGRSKPEITPTRAIDRGLLIIALVWQGQMLDLLGKRDEALSAYKKAADYEVDNRHDQYGLVVNKQYIQQRIATPFTRVENNMTD